jgi:hypothetical protein
MPKLTDALLAAIYALVVAAGVCGYYAVVTSTMDRVSCVREPAQVRTR